MANSSAKLSSMTGFARGQGVSGAYAWSWEIKSVNAKGLDVRFRLPPGWDAVEGPVRKAATDALLRGTVYANLTIERKGVQPTVKINEAVLTAVIAALDRLDDKVVGANRPTLDGILSLKGVMEIVEDDESEGDRRAAESAIIAGFFTTLAELVVMRRAEGATLGKLLMTRLDEIAALAARAEAAPGRKAEAIKARLAEQVAALLSASQRFDSDRLHQEAILLATKADIREELDRLASHGEQVRKLLSDGGAVGRKLDFLAQELNRESNTLTAKANDLDLSNIGLELKGVVEQFREQVQNLE
ncbi:MAG: YicC/YloC family endoribonuclease [Pseudolabrys sp.]|nr:YicC/YloC family endoribonuclease [Pseudolabrys sp.]